ncbi:hypothetical protein ACIQTZ_07630 [Paenarthrobacter sp. NPDC090520]|uniref:hypothetical protein n=1 Tax=Paenarthrobacter sp. NPDC090520 TaxID=3364382 RepID=UPI0038235B99
MVIEFCGAVLNVTSDGFGNSAVNPVNHVQDSGQPQAPITRLLNPPSLREHERCGTSIKKLIAMFPHSLARQLNTAWHNPMLSKLFTCYEPWRRESDFRLRSRVTDLPASEVLCGLFTRKATVNYLL